MIDLYPHQQEAVDILRSGSILVGGTGSGKTRTSIAYFYQKECPGDEKKDLYIITTARNRDDLKFEKECAPFGIFSDPELSVKNIKLTVDSWNNIKKYINIENAFFIFDEQRLVGYGTWAKSFLKIAKHNRWILLSATPGDVWMDYVPVFIANGFYKNKTAFCAEHVIFKPHVSWPQVDHYVGEKKLAYFKNKITVEMRYHPSTIRHVNPVAIPYKIKDVESVLKNRWNPYTDEPIKTISEVGHVIRRVLHDGCERTEYIRSIMREHSKIIIFYNYNYEKKALIDFAEKYHIPFAQYNGLKHEPIPKEDRWLYFVQYTAGNEGWDCIETNAIIFYSLNYSYKVMVQASGRIDRVTTSFKDLYYYILYTDSRFDKAIIRALKNKKKFNEKKFFDARKLHSL